VSSDRKSKIFKYLHLIRTNSSISRLKLNELKMCKWRERDVTKTNIKSKNIKRVVDRDLMLIVDGSLVEPSISWQKTTWSFK